MKTRLSFLLVALLVACSAPKKYSYNFDHYQYKTEKKAVNQPDKHEAVSTLVNRAEEAELKSQSDEMIASQSQVPVLVEQNPIVIKAEAIVDKYQDFRDTDVRSEKRAIRKELKRDVKELRKDVKRYVKERRADDSVTSTKALDGDLKLALIFLLLSLVGYVLFWPLGTALFIVSIVFFILWLSRQ